MLEHIRTYGFYIPFGCDILTLLFNEIQQLDLIQSGNISFYKNICLSILTYTSIPYLSILSRWLGLKQHNNTEWTDFNRIHDPYSEFFICEKPNPVDALDTFKVWYSVY
jgi:hypothetical protein